MREKTDPKRNVAVLGATGSIGASTLDVIARHPDRFSVGAIAANRKWEALLELVRRFRPPWAALLDPAAARQLGDAVRRENLPTRVLSGDEGLCRLAALPEIDTVVAGIVGAAGLASTLSAAGAGKRILLANKETLVLAGALFMAAVREGNATLLPIDSEHNAIFQCMPSAADTATPASRGVRRILLTASGGPFLHTPHAELASATPDAACAHPNWRMGRKISVDSATMMNKGLEVIEAHWLFGIAPDAIEVVIHPQSIVHSMVEYLDGSVLAQMGNPDMRTPIAQALAWPDRIDAGVASLDLAHIGALHFATPDQARFPCLALAYAALRAGGTATVVLNAANEVAVGAFLERQIGYLDISGTCEATLSRMAVTPVESLSDALEADAAARRLAQRMIGPLAQNRRSA
ncbi:MAG: 1-deoxy-D-xylulose-5-phosphate reductoisomerase [Betaproteobacteria bacterium]